MRPDPYARAIAGVVRDLINTREGTSYFVEKISGASLHYDLPRSHPLIGFSAPDLEFQDGSRLGELLHDGRGLLLDLTENTTLEAQTQGWAGRVRYLPGRAKDNLGLAAFLVRPDGFVAWATDGAPDLTTLRAALETWCGRPS
jgi:hypothetical protein